MRERTAHINRIKGLLFGQGIRGINVKVRYKTLTPAALVTADGRPLPDRLGREITREIAINIWRANRSNHSGHRDFMPPSRQVALSPLTP